MGLKQPIRDILNFFKGFCFNPWLFLLFITGVFLRLKPYLEGYPLWVDESYRALQIIIPTWKEIFYFTPILPGQPESPLGLVVVQKLLITFFGPHENVLRFVPFLCGVSTIFLYYIFLKRYFDSQILFLALSLVVFNERLIYYSTELKPYSSDVFFSLLLYIFMFNIHHHQYKRQDLMRFGIVAGIFMWFSHATLFITATITLWIGYRFYKYKEYKEMLNFSLIVLFWICNFLAIYYLSFGSMVGNDKLIGMWGDGFLRYRILSLDFISWLRDVIVAAFARPIGVYFPIITIPVFILGCIILSKKQCFSLFLLLGPVLLVLLAAICKKYPFKERMLLFLVPAFMVLISYGYITILSFMKRWRIPVSCVLGFILLFYPVTQSVSFLFKSRQISDNHKILSYLDKNYQTGDFICLNVSGTLPYWYYGYLLKFNNRLFSEKIETYKGPLYTSPEIGIFYEEVHKDDGGHSFVEYSVEQVYYTADGRYQFCHTPRVILPIYENSSLEFFQSKRVWLVFLEMPDEAKEFVLKLFKGRAQKISQEVGKRGLISLYLLDHTLN